MIMKAVGLSTDRVALTNRAPGSAHAPLMGKLPLNALAKRQARVLSRTQVLGAGGTDELIKTRLTGGRWQRLHPGVFLTHTGPVSRAAQIWAALLYAGAAATVSHQTAAELWGLVDDPTPLVHVTVPATRRVTPRPGIGVHYAHRLPQTRHPARVPPVGTVEDTVLDLVDTAPNLRQVIDWVSRACQRRKTTPGRLLGALATRKKIRWRAAIRDVLADVSNGAETPLEVTYPPRRGARAWAAARYASAAPACRPQHPVDRCRLRPVRGTGGARRPAWARR